MYLSKYCINRSVHAEVRNVSQAFQPLVSEIILPVKQDMKSPIHIYYLLHNFFQSHKRYVRSVSYGQLHGADVSASALDACKPQRYLTNKANESFEAEGLINPCGLAAWSLFNDTFTDFKVCALYCRTWVGISPGRCCSSVYMIRWTHLGTLTSGMVKLLLRGRLALLTGFAKADPASTNCHI